MLKKTEKTKQKSCKTSDFLRIIENEMYTRCKITPTAAEAVSEKIVSVAGRQAKRNYIRCSSEK